MLPPSQMVFLLRHYIGGGLLNLLQYYIGRGGGYQDPQNVLRNIWTAPYCRTLKKNLIKDSHPQLNLGPSSFSSPPYIVVSSISLSLWWLQLQVLRQFECKLQKSKSINWSSLRKYKLIYSDLWGMIHLFVFDQIILTKQTITITKMINGTMPSKFSCWIILVLLIQI